MVGDGNLKDAMLQRIDNYGIKDKVVYLGRTEDIHKLYNAMDCCLLPSLYEGLPVVGVEAECTGLPMFFSTAVPEESSPCEDLGYFVGLDKSSKEWATFVLEKTRKLKDRRTGRIEEVKLAGFDSATEAKKLEEFYIGLINKL